MLDVKTFHMSTFIPMPYEEALAPRLKLAQDKLQSGSGAELLASPAIKKAYLGG